MGKKTGTIAIVLAVIELCLSAVSLSMTLNSSKQQVQDGEEDKEDIQYVMYLGTNDKDSNEPVFSPEEAKSKVEEILIKHFGGYTIQEANGGWADDGKLYQEYTLVIYLSDTGIDQIHAAADEMVETFHQSSVLIQSNRTSTEFYSGK